MADITQDAYEILNLRATLDGIANQMSLMQTFNYSGMEMAKNDTTIAGNQYGTDTCHVDNYGTITMTFKCEPKSKDWIQRVKDQYEGNLAGAKPNGGFELTNRKGEVTSTWNILAWHIESFAFPTLDAKDNSQLMQEVTIRVEKVERA